MIEQVLVVPSEYGDGYYTVNVARLADVVFMFVERQHDVDHDSLTSDAARWADNDTAKVDCAHRPASTDINGCVLV